MPQGRRRRGWAVIAACLGVLGFASSGAWAQPGSPDIRGTYNGSGSLTLANCTIQTFNGVKSLNNATVNIPTQTGADFSGTMTGSLSPIPASVNANLAGAVQPAGDVSGNFDANIVVQVPPQPISIPATGTFTGALAGNTLTLNIDAHATAIETCTVKGTVTVDRQTTVLAASILPSSRSVQVPIPGPVVAGPAAGGGNTTATAFATVINGGSTAALGCSIAPATSVPATFFYQTTDPNTNQLTGTPNTPVDIPFEKSQTFVISFTPTGAFPPTNVQLNFSCVNAPPAGTISGVNTLLLSGSVAPVPDVVALVATPFHNDGIADIPGPSGTGFFSVASVNVGASAQLTVSANTGGAVLPVNLSVCQTNPVTGVCLATLGPSVQVQINSGETPTFAVFITGTGSNVPFDPANNRVFVVFKDGTDAVRGSASVAIRTVATP